MFEILTASLRERGGQVLKFIGDAMLAIFPFEDADRAETCRRALDAAIEAMRNIEALNAVRASAGAPLASVDLALHLGDVLYGNVGAIDRLDFTVIGPAINEATRIEALCHPLDRAVLVSAEFVAGMKAADRQAQVDGPPRFARRQGAERDLRPGFGRSASLGARLRGRPNPRLMPREFRRGACRQ